MMYQTILNDFCSFQLDKLVTPERLLIDNAHWIRLGENVEILQIPEILNRKLVNLEEQLKIRVTGLGKLKSEQICML